MYVFIVCIYCLLLSIWFNKLNLKGSHNMFLRQILWILRRGRVNNTVQLKLWSIRINNTFRLKFWTKANKQTKQKQKTKKNFTTNTMNNQGNTFQLKLWPEEPPCSVAGLTMSLNACGISSCVLQGTYKCFSCNTYGLFSNLHRDLRRAFEHRSMTSVNRVVVAFFFREAFSSCCYLYQWSTHPSLLASFENRLSN